MLSEWLFSAAKSSLTLFAPTFVKNIAVSFDVLTDINGAASGSGAA
jgi:hypothetical protein